MGAVAELGADAVRASGARLADLGGRDGAAHRIANANVVARSGANSRTRSRKNGRVVARRRKVARARPPRARMRDRPGRCVARERGASAGDPVAAAATRGYGIRRGARAALGARARSRSARKRDAIVTPCAAGCARRGVPSAASMLRSRLFAELKSSPTTIAPARAPPEPELAW